MNELPQSVTDLIAYLNELTKMASVHPEAVHSMADAAILRWMDHADTRALREIAAAYHGVIRAASWWATA